MSDDALIKDLIEQCQKLSARLGATEKQWQEERLALENLAFENRKLQGRYQAMLKLIAGLNEIAELKSWGD